MYRSGWANSCGIELFTHGWVSCEQAIETLTQEYGGGQFNSGYLVFQPVIKQVENKLPVSGLDVESLEESDINLDDVVFDSDGESYGLQIDKSAESTLNELKDVDAVIQKAASAISVPKSAIRKKLIEIVSEELKKNRDIKIALFSDDDEIIEILLLTGEL